MCGRFTYLFTWRELHDQLEAFGIALDELGAGVEEHPQRFNIAPTQPIIVIHEDHGKFKASLMRWGLVPGWVKDPSKFSLIINARAETIREKPSFRGSLRHHRCIVPANGYYEWQKRPDGSKQPFYISAEGGKVMAFAAVYSVWQGPSGEEVDTTAIITVAAGPHLAHLHDREPVIIPLERIAEWLDVRGHGEAEAFALLSPAPAGAVNVHPVSTRVNSNRNDGPDLIARLPPDAATGTPPGPGRKRASGQGELF